MKEKPNRIIRDPNVKGTINIKILKNAVKKVSGKCAPSAK